MMHYVMKISRSAEVIVARTEWNAQWATDLMPFENH
jgi:hypothetical protein